MCPLSHYHAIERSRLRIKRDSRYWLLSRSQDKSHARRYFHDIVKVRPATATPGLADEALARIDTLFRLERQWKACSDEQRLALRQRFSAPILTEFKAWLDCHGVHTAPKTLLGKAIRYTLNLWPRLIRFLDDGRLVISNNETEVRFVDPKPNPTRVRELGPELKRGNDRRFENLIPV